MGEKQNTKQYKNTENIKQKTKHKNTNLKWIIEKYKKK